MRTYPETLTENLTPKANWPLALCAGLLGIGQNGLLVMLPQLVTLTGLSLSVWAGLLMFGSMLFLPASPWWGRQSERHGCKVVMQASLSGYLASFVVMALVVWAMASDDECCLGAGGLILSRTLYGLTVSGWCPRLRHGPFSARVWINAWPRWRPLAPASAAVVCWGAAGGDDA